MEQLLQLINAIYFLSDELELLLRKKVRRDDFKKKQKLLRPGQRCNRLYFIERGLLRIYARQGGKEYSSWFMKEGDIATSVTSFFGRSPSIETIEVLEDCTLWSIEWQELEELYERFPPFRKVGQRLTEKYYCQDDRLKLNLLMKSPDEFYDYLAEHHSGVVQRVPTRYLASYMRISAQTLLPIKKRWNETHKEK